MKLKTSHSHPIRVDFIHSDEFPILNRMGMTFAPGKKQSDALSGVWNRDLKTDLERLSDEFCVGTLISLVEDSELQELSILDLAEECARVTINLVRFPIRDVSVPESMEDFVRMVAVAVDSLREGDTVVTHCKGGLGRAGLAAACVAVAATDAEMSASEAIELVREARPGAIETEAQENFVADFEAEWREVMANRGDHYLLYWQERSVQDHAGNDLPLDVVASNGLFGVKQGDTLWIVTLTEEREFMLAGRLVVGDIVEYEEAFRRMPDAGLWQAEYYAFPEPGTEEFLRPVSLMGIAEQLRFDGENDRLTIRDGKINPQQLRKRRKLTPESAEAITRIWEESAEITDPEELVAAWQQIVEEQPDDPGAHYNLAVALGQVDRTEEAVREYQETIRLDPDYLPALYNLGNHFVHARRFDQAIEMFNRAILVDGDYAPVHFMLGVAYFESGRFHDAIAATRQGLEVDPDDESAYYNIAYWTFRQGDHQRAIELASEVSERAPKRTDAVVLKGRCYRELGQLDNEIDAYKEALDIGMDLDAFIFLGAAWERKVTGSDEGVEYIETNGSLDLQDPTHLFYFEMGNIALGIREGSSAVLETLRASAPDLARRLERFSE
jgi:tetratricopeptide (TPR) repeat protein/protein-tyrosine phosphatase